MSQPKRAKSDDNTMETTSSVSEENYTGGASGNPQLTEISAKLSLLLTAVNEQTALNVNEQNSLYLNSCERTNSSQTARGF